MNEILAIAHAPEHDDALLAELSRRTADRITILVPDPGATDGPEGEQRMADLVCRAEWVTGAAAVGVAAPAEALDGRMFDTVVHASSPVRRRWRLRSSSRRERASGLAVLSPGGAR